MTESVGAAIDICFGATVAEFMRYVTDLGLDHVELKREYLAGHPDTPANHFVFEMKSLDDIAKSVGSDSSPPDTGVTDRA